MQLAEWLPASGPDVPQRCSLNIEYHKSNGELSQSEEHWLGVKSSAGAPRSGVKSNATHPPVLFSVKGVVIYQHIIVQFISKL